MLEVRSLNKRFGNKVAVEGVSFAVAPGQMLGLLGPNGAGKTTTVSMIVGQVLADSGEVLVDGKPLRGDTDPGKRKIGLVPQDLALYEELTAQDNLEFFGALYDLPADTLAAAITKNLALVGLADRAKDKVKTYSGGMKRRLNLAAALLHDPQILLLDEPTVGVDPQSRNAIFDNLEALKRAGKAIVYTTHYMEEAERLCDRIVIVDNGRVMADDTVRGLFRKVPAANRLSVELDEAGAAGAGEWLPTVRALPGVTGAELADGLLRLQLTSLTTDAPVVLRWLADHGHAYSHVTSERADLESIFLTLTGRSLRDS